MTALSCFALLLFLGIVTVCLVFVARVLRYGSVAVASPEKRATADQPTDQPPGPALRAARHRCRRTALAQNAAPPDRLVSGGRRPPAVPLEEPLPGDDSTRPPAGGAPAAAAARPAAPRRRSRDALARR